MIAVLVVFMVDTEREGLIRLFLDKLRANTEHPYRIYASIDHLSPAQRERLEDAPDLKKIECNIDDIHRDRDEHRALLNTLRAEALNDGAEYFVTVHLDSFPIRRGWEHDLIQKLDEGNRFAVVLPFCFSACLFWGADFEKELNPRFHVPEEERAGADFERFQAENPGIDLIDNGIGFIYDAWRLNWKWHALEPTARQIYGGMFFHLVGGIRLTSHSTGELKRSPIVGVLLFLNKFAKSLVPDSLRMRVRKQFIEETQATRDGTRLDKKQQLDALIADPEAYLDECFKLPAGT